MLVMTPSPAAVRLMLIERRDTVAPRDPRAPKVRRYRLARLALNERPGSRPRYDHLTQTYD
jgi:hypothetical protein